MRLCNDVYVMLLLGFFMGCIYTIILVPRRNVYVLFECWDCFQSTKPSSAIFRLCCCLGDAEICRLSCPGDSVLTAVLVIFHVTFVGWSCSALRSGPAASHKQPSRSLDHQPKEQTRNKVKTVFNAKKTERHCKRVYFWFQLTLSELDHS